MNTRARANEYFELVVAQNNTALHAENNFQFDSCRHIGLDSNCLAPFNQKYDMTWVRWAFVCVAASSAILVSAHTTKRTHTCTLNFGRWFVRAHPIH